MAIYRPYRSTLVHLKRGVIPLTACAALAYAIAALLGARGILLLVSPLIAALISLVTGQTLSAWPRTTSSRAPDQPPGATPTARR